MSSGVPAFTGRASPEPSAPPVAVITEPNALNNTLAKERPMALLIIRVRRIPDAPTSVPATIRRLLSRVNPEAATASPVKELSSEMRTGTSAPPMGSTKMTPRTSDRTAVATSRGTLPVTRVAMASAAIATPTTALITCWAG